MTTKPSFITPEALQRAREDALVEDSLGRPLVVVDPGYASPDSMTYCGFLGSRIIITALAALAFALSIAGQVLPIYSGVRPKEKEKTYFSVWQSWKIRAGHRVEVHSGFDFFALLLVLQSAGFVAVAAVYVVLSLLWVVDERARRLECALNALVIAEFDQARRSNRDNCSDSEGAAVNTRQDEFLYANYHFCNNGEVRMVPRECREVTRLRREDAWMRAGRYTAAFDALISMANGVLAIRIAGLSNAHPSLVIESYRPGLVLLTVVWVVACLVIAMVVLDTPMRESSIKVSDLPKRCTLMAVDFHYFDNGGEEDYVRRRVAVETERIQRRTEHVQKRQQQHLQ